MLNSASLSIGQATQTSGSKHTTFCHEP